MVDQYRRQAGLLGKAATTEWMASLIRMHLVWTGSTFRRNGTKTEMSLVPGAIRDFFGSLDRFKAAKGLFATTSSFSSSAGETAELLSKRIVLLDGRQLAKLMIRYNVGCRVEETIHIKAVDEEFFE
jgi:hypothetical protein